MLSFGGVKAINFVHVNPIAKQISAKHQAFYTILNVIGVYLV